MMAVILAGGKGTRLKPFTMSIPKPLLPLGDVPILEVVLQQLARAGVQRVVLTLGHMAHLFTACIGDGERFGLKIDYCREDSPLGTAGSLTLVKDPEESMIVMNGDLLTTLDYGALLRYHDTQKAKCTIAVHRRTHKVDYGVIHTVNGNLERYEEKPQMHYLVSMGINIVSRDALKHIPPGKYFDMPSLMQATRDSGETVACFESECYWQDIGRFDDYQAASADFDKEPERFTRIEYTKR
jgi:NDP-sugar pyrophosphorylase family protein